MVAKMRPDESEHFLFQTITLNFALLLVVKFAR